MEEFRKTIRDDAADLLEGITELLGYGDRFALHPANFGSLDGYYNAEEEEGLKKIIVESVFAELGDLILVKKEGGTKIFATNRPDILLGFDGTDWWLELKND